MGSISKVNICFVLCTLTRDYDGIKSRAAGCRNNGERKKRPVSSANLHSLIISLILSCHLLKVVFLPLSLEALAVNQTLLYLFLSESISKRLSKIRLAWDMGQSYAEKRSQFKQNCLNHINFYADHALVILSSTKELSILSKVHSSAKHCFSIFALIFSHIHILFNLCCQFSPAMQDADGRLW